MLQLRKIIADIRFNKTRTMLTVLTIAIGVFMVGVISRSWQILSREITNSFASINPHHGVIFTVQPFDEDLVEAIERLPEVKAAEGRRTEYLSVQVGPDTWRSMELVTIADFNDLRVNKISSIHGSWPPPTDSILLEQSSLSLLPDIIGDSTDPSSIESVSPSILVEQRTGKQHNLTVAGFASDLSLYPSDFSKVAYGYITPKTLQKLTGSQGYQSLHFVVAEQGDNKAHIEQVMDKVRRKMTSSQVSIRHQEIIGLSQHPLNNILQASLFILAVLSVLALLLSSFQVVNTISALMAHQIRQIGILKSMGATDRNIFLMYITLVMSFSLLAMVAAFPWTTLGAQGLVRFMGEVLNVPITNFTISPFGYLPEFIAGVAMPLLVAWGPIKNSVRITVSEAINHTNRQAASFGTNRVDRLLNRIRGLPSSVLYTFRNVFRNKKRLLFTLIVLTIAGTIFMTVTGIRSSLLLTLDAVSAYRQQDIEIKFEQQERVQEIAHVAHQVTGIAHVETRLETTASMRYHNQAADGINISLFGLSADTLFLQPTIIEGRWLLPEDEQALVVNAEFLLEMPDTQIGDEIVLELNNRATSWRIVGIVLGQVVGGNQILAPIAYTNYTNLSAVVGGSGRANRLLVAVDSQASGEIILQQLREQFNRQGLKVRSTALQQEILETVRVPFNIILSVVFIMIILFVVAGGLGLMGLISLNVLERTREFGVIRAIGATRKVITRTVLLEGVFIGILSWFVALWLALPMSKIMSNIVGLLFLNVPLNYIFPLTGMLVWLVIVIPLSTLASLLPAWNATRLSISQILSYE